MQGFNILFQALKSSLDSVEKSVSTVKTEFPAFGDNTGLNKELQGLRKRYEGVAVHAEKVQATLRTFLRKFHGDKQAGLQRALAALKEKIAWCEPEPSSDRYNLEVKLTSLEGTSVLYSFRWWLLALLLGMRPAAEREIT